MLSSRTAATASVIGLLLMAAPLRSQSTQPVDGHLLRPGIDTFAVSYGGQLIGRGIQVLEPSDETGAMTWKQTYTFRSQGSDESTDTLFMDVATLRPLREARASSVGRFRIEFSPTEIVSTTLAVDGAPVTTRVPLERAVFSSASLESVVRSLPLGDGMRSTVDLYYPLPATTGATRVSVRVLRSETVTTPGGASRAAWVVIAGEPGEATTFWIDKADRTLLQFDTEEGSAVIQFRR